MLPIQSFNLNPTETVLYDHKQLLKRKKSSSLPDTKMSAQKGPKELNSYVKGLLAVITISY